MRRRSVKPLALLGWAALGCSVWGCTFLIDFDPVSDAGTTTLPDGEVVPIADTGTDARVADAGADVLAEPPCDTTFPLAQVGGCQNFQDNGQICAKNPSLTYPAGHSPTNDVVTCKRTGTAGSASCVRHCTGSGGCASLPNGFADQCDTCQGKPNGTYCGNAMGFRADEARLLVTCASNKVSTVVACDAGCAARTDTQSRCN